MSDLISKETLINEIVNTPTNSDGYNPVYLSGSATRQLEILDIINELPSVSEQEIRNKAIDTFMIAIETLVKLHGAVSVSEIKEIAEQMKEVT